MERRIKSLCEDARTILSHGMHAWPQVVTKSLWPFALKASCRARNKFNLDEDNLQIAVGMISALVTNVNPTPKLYNKMKHIVNSKVREHAD